ncbi:MAG: hypothetical protein ACYC35_19635 [Pirellulales bacterium]
MTLRTLSVSCLMAALGTTGGLVGAESPAKPDYAAAFVRMTVPESVRVHEAFPVTITVRNTGSRTWEGASIRLRLVDSSNRRGWGTDYILIAQGTAVKAGQEYAFRSYLKAPATPGKVSFQWQVRKDGEDGAGEKWFGQLTPARTIDVVARAAAPRQAVAPRDASAGKKVLSFGDFEYLGSFKPPMVVGQSRGAFSDTGLALRAMPDGRDRLFVNYTHPTQALFEIEIPELGKVRNGAHADLKTAAVKQVWGSLNIPVPGEEPLSPNGGFVWLEAKQTLVWTWYHGYKTGDAPPVLAATRLSKGAVTHAGPWRVAAPGGLYKSYWGGVLPLPKAFADQYTGGKTLALGFGGYYSICAAASRGPALGAIPDPTEGQKSVPVTAMLYHPHESPAPRDGDYFNANCGFWSEQPAGPEQGTWTYDDWCRAGAFAETKTGRAAYLAFVREGTGRLGYDFGTITSAGSAEYWYCYDPKDLGAAARGQTTPWKIAPSSMTRVGYPLGRTVTGACFDARTGRLYVCLSWAYPDGLESFPVIHVYRVE